jgi:hypothetical protein
MLTENMKFQNVIDEIRAICKKHDIVLVGTCQSEGIYGEIFIGRLPVEGWIDFDQQITNTIEPAWGSGFVVSGIG